MFEKTDSTLLCICGDITYTLSNCLMAVYLLPAKQTSHELFHWGINKSGNLRSIQAHYTPIFHRCPPLKQQTDDQMTRCIKGTIKTADQYVSSLKYSLNLSVCYIWFRTSFSMTMSIQFETFAYSPEVSLGFKVTLDGKRMSIQLDIRWKADVK